MDKFKVTQSVLKGDIADVWEGIHLSSQTPVHIVTFEKKGHTPIDSERFAELTKKLPEINHPNLLKYHRIVQSEKSIGIIMEHPGGGTLRDYLLKRPDRRIDEEEARHFFKQIVNVVEYLFVHNICHRNLNLKNIFINQSKNELKVGDFLLCSKIGPIYKPNSSTSSYHFYAPEIWLEDGSSVGHSADIWSLGVLLYVMVCGSYPFIGRHEFDIFLSVKRGDFIIPSRVSPNCANLMKAMLNPNLEQRPTLSQIKCHPWYNEDSKNPQFLNQTSPINFQLTAILEEPEIEQIQNFPNMQNLNLKNNNNLTSDFPSFDTMTKKSTSDHAEAHKRQLQGILQKFWQSRKPTLGPKSSIHSPTQKRRRSLSGLSEIRRPINTENRSLSSAKPKTTGTRNRSQSQNSSLLSATIDNPLHYQKQNEYYLPPQTFSTPTSPILSSEDEVKIEPEQTINQTELLQDLLNDEENFDIDIEAFLQTTDMDEIENSSKDWIDSVIT